MIDGSWNLADFEQDVWERRAKPETHDVAGFGLAALVDQIEKDERGIDRNARQRQRLDRDDAERRERIAKNKALLREYAEAERRFHDEGVIDERLLPTGEGHAGKVAAAERKDELAKRQAALEAEHGVTFKARQRGHKNVFEIEEASTVPTKADRMGEMRTLIRDLAERTARLIAALPRPRVRLVTTLPRLFNAVQDVFATPFLLPSGPKRQDE